MAKQRDINRWKKGREHWNRWAEGRLKAKEKLEKKGMWKVDWRGDGANAEAKRWTASASVDFSEHVFEDDVNFSGFQFPYSAIFNNATFKGIAGFDSATFKGNAGFGSATFESYAVFDVATFEGTARFGGAMFKEVAWFNSATLAGTVWFDSATFEESVGFDGATFEGNVGFDDAKFKGTAEFGNTTFKQTARFSGATFEGDAWFASATFERDAWFLQATFSSYTSFANAEFADLANFVAVHGERAFTLAGARFGKVPGFIQAHFSEAPQLDNLTLSRGVELGSFWASIKGAVDPDVTARYRALKRLAIQAHDHDREHLFFAGELRARRGTLDRALPNPLNLFRKDDQGRRMPLWRGGWRFWFGIAYELFSGFGRSFARPLIALSLSFALFASAYLGAHFKEREETGRPYAMTVSHWLARHVGLYPLDRRPILELECVEGEKGGAGSDPATLALLLSLKKSLLFIGWEQAEKINQGYACLYGTRPSYSARRADGARVPHIPDRVFLLSLLQSIVSVILIFLFLLAVRNYFKIK